MGNFKKERKMKVYAQSGYKYKDIATIILKGDWLEDCGFEPGTPIRVPSTKRKVNGSSIFMNSILAGLPLKG